MPELEERWPEGEVSTTVPYLSIHEIAERLGVSAEAAYALVKATLRG